VTHSNRFRRPKTHHEMRQYAAIIYRRIGTMCTFIPNAAGNVTGEPSGESSARKSAFMNICARFCLTLVNWGQATQADWNQA
jgi:hypothetical protein